MKRREFLQQSIGLAGLLCAPQAATVAVARDRREPLPVAGVTTVYRDNSHADVILGKILEGYRQKGGRGPALKLVSMYVDQLPDGDMSRRLCEKHGIPLCKTIEEAVTVGGNGISVAGVISIAEHGNYPYTEKTRQHQYPRRRFFDEITATFEKHGRVVPVFNDKHLAWNWKDAWHMYKTAQRLKIPFMAGSSIPVAWREPTLLLPQDCRIESALGIGYGGLEGYGFHALEGLQCMIERRRGGESGVRSVQAVRGDAIFQAERDGWWSSELFESAMQGHSKFNKETWREQLSDNAAFYLIEHRDGLKSVLAMAIGVSDQFAFAAKLRGQPEPVHCRFALEEMKPWGHFSQLLRGIESLVHTKQPAYPVERTLLTTGILDRAMNSLANESRKYDTPELNFRYAGSDWPFATGNVGDLPA